MRERSSRRRDSAGRKKNQSPRPLLSTSPYLGSSLARPRFASARDGDISVPHGDISPSLAKLLHGESTKMPTRRRARAATSPEERVPSCSSSPKSPLAQTSYLEPELPSLPPAEMATEEAVEQVFRLHAAVARLHALGTKLEAENRRCLNSPSLSAGLSAVSRKILRRPFRTQAGWRARGTEVAHFVD